MMLGSAIRSWQSRRAINRHTKTRLQELRQRRALYLADFDQWSERQQAKLSDELAKIDRQIEHLEKQVQ